MSTSDPQASLLDANPFDKSKLYTLDWSRSDIEQRFWFRGGRFTTPNKWLSFLIGLFVTVAFYGVLHAIHLWWPHDLWWRQVSWLADMFTQRGITPYPTVLFFFWAMAILWLKRRKLALQERALNLNAVPQDPDFELTTVTARTVLDRLHALVDGTGHFVLLNRIERALSNLKNIGQVSDVATILKTQADHDEGHVASSYGLVNGFIWAIPVLGFIGTVLGLSQSIGAFGLTLQAEGDLTAIKDSLKEVTAGLATAFETTLIALVCALVLYMRTTFLQQKESEFLDSCADYCHKTVAARLRLSAPA